MYHQTLKPMLKKTTFLIIISFIFAACQQAEKNLPNKEPLSLWNDSKVKTAIVDFVEKVTDDTAVDFVPIEDRIAVFDNDGTLWCEKPLYIPVELQFEYIKTVYQEKPEWKSDDLYKGIAEGDMSVLKNYSTEELIGKLFAANAGQKEEDYKRFVYETLSSAHHKKFNRPFKEMTYTPMIELIHYLQANNFNVYIVTGGEISSVRTVSEEIYNIPKENVIGSSVLLTYNYENGKGYLTRTEKINSANDKQVKPTNIELHIGRKPIFAAGNSDGDYQMMEYTLSGTTPSLAILVHHDDEEREYSSMHGTEKAVEDAPTKGWHVVSMKNDFKEIFSE